MSYFGQAGVFLVQVLFSLYITIVMIRFLLQQLRADFYNPVSQLVVKLTSPPLRPLRRIIPGLGGVDIASLVLMFLLQFLELWLISLMVGAGLGAVVLAILSLAELLSLCLNVFLFSILVQVIISWINPGSYNPLISLLYQLNEPLMRPARRLLPPVSGMDLSPIIVLLVLQLAKIVIVAPIRDLAGGHLPM